MCLAAKCDLEAAFKDFLRFDEFSVKPLQLLALLEHDLVVALAVTADVDVRDFFLLYPSKHVYGQYSLTVAGPVPLALRQRKQCSHAIPARPQKRLAHVGETDL